MRSPRALTSFSTNSASSQVVLPERTVGVLTFASSELPERCRGGNLAVMLQYKPRATLWCINIKEAWHFSQPGSQAVLRERVRPTLLAHARYFPGCAAVDVYNYAPRLSKQRVD